jgi:hypothetical protein
MSQQALSPEMQLMQQPSFVYSHLQIPQVRLHWQMQMPFWQQQQLHRPSHSIRQRFCSVPQLTSSSHLQWILNPPVHFSNLTLQRGSTHQLAEAGEPAGYVVGCQPGVCPPKGATAVADRSNKVEDAIIRTPFKLPILQAAPAKSAVSMAKPTKTSLPAENRLDWLTSGRPVRFAQKKRKTSRAMGG